MWRVIRRPGASASTRNIVAPPRSPGLPDVRAMQIVYAAPSAPVMNHLRPLTSQPPVGGRGGGRQRGRVGAGARGGLGHREAGPDLAQGERTQVALLLLGGRDGVEQVHVALVGSGDVERERAEQRPARLLEDHGAAAHVEPVPAVLLGDVRREDAGVARGLLQVGAQLLATGGHHAREPLLLGCDDGADERRGPRRQLGDVRVGGQVDRTEPFRGQLSRVSARARARSAMRDHLPAAGGHAVVGALAAEVAHVELLHDDRGLPAAERLVPRDVRPGEPLPGPRRRSARRPRRGWAGRRSRRRGRRRPESRRPASSSAASRGR